jgi:hypothetical protein
MSVVVPKTLQLRICRSLQQETHSLHKLVPPFAVHKACRLQACKTAAAVAAVALTEHAMSKAPAMWSVVQISS